MAWALATGTLTIPDLRNASSTTRALGGMRKIPPETPLMVSEPPDPVSGCLSAAAGPPAPVEPPGSPGEAAELLDDLLLALFGLPKEDWAAVNAALPDELTDRISRFLDL